MAALFYEGAAIFIFSLRNKHQATGPIQRRSMKS